MTTEESQIDTSVPHSARRYNYWLGGKDHFEVDRRSGDKVAAAFPPIRTAARLNRAFLQRAVRFLAAEAGIRQYLDVGTGLPTADNTHEVAQAIAPASRIVYVDNDPIVLVHARALLTSTREGVTTYAEADLSRPDTILKAAQLREILDLGQPVALLLVAVLHFLPDDAVAADAVRQLVAALAPGSFVVLSHAASDLLDDASRERIEAMFDQGNEHGPFQMRAKGQIAAFVEGLELIDPGLVPIQTWRADTDTDVLPDDQVGMYGVVAYKEH